MTPHIIWIGGICNVQMVKEIVESEAMNNENA